MALASRTLFYFFLRGITASAPIMLRLAPPPYFSINTASSSAVVAQEREDKGRKHELREHDLAMNHKALDATHVSQPYAYTLAPPRMTFIPLTVALAPKLLFDLAVRLQYFAPKILGAGTFGPVCNPISPRPDIGRAMSSFRQRWHVVAVRVLGGTPSFHSPPSPLARPRR